MRAVRSYSLSMLRVLSGDAAPLRACDQPRLSDSLSASPRAWRAAVAIVLDAVTNAARIDRAGFSGCFVIPWESWALAPTDATDPVQLTQRIWSN
ncbi:hypothetical protein DRB06_07890 [Actinomyces sp. Z5]|nr:hypothetical protein DRB06_07890 [Actinomyces sp. Z5]